MYQAGFFSAVWVVGTLGALGLSLCWVQIISHYKLRHSFKPVTTKIILILSCLSVMFVLEYASMIFNPWTDFLFYLTELLKSICIYNFLDILIMLLGWENIDISCYSQAKVESILIRINETKGCITAIKLENHEDVSWFLMRIKIGSIQYLIVSFGVFFASLFLKFNVNDNLKFGNLDLWSGFLWLSAFRLISALLEFFDLILLENCLTKVDFLRSFRVQIKFKAIKFFFIVTELQPLALSALSNYTNVLGDSSNTPSYKSSFAISFFYSVEILILFVSFLNAFPAEEMHKDDKNNDNLSTITDICTARE
jgi:Organic solute transporter Ostalpha